MKRTTRNHIFFRLPVLCSAALFLCAFGILYFAHFNVNAQPYGDRADNGALSSDQADNGRQQARARQAPGDNPVVEEYDSERPDGRYDTRNPYCRELEQKLAADWVRGNQSTTLIPELNQKIRKQDALFNKYRNRADHMNCYEDMFIFGRTLKRTKKCYAIDRKIRTAKRELERLRDQRDAIRDARRDGNRRQRIIAELARYDCGDQYRYEARRSRGNWFEDSGLGELFGGPPRSRPRPRGDMNTSIQPYATYRTMCVRLCDGYYFPISFSTLPSNFATDAELCHSKCAAPAELYVYPNPGGEVAQMITPDGSPYDSIENAWRYRKEYIKGCSCKESEYSQAEIEAHNAGTKQAGGKMPAATTKTARRKTAAAERSAGAPLPSKPKPGKAKTIEDLIR